MSLKSLLMPAISERLLSRERLERQRLRHERKRKAQASPHLVHYFHQVDDPYSDLTAAILPRLTANYAIELQAHVVGPPSDAAAPERARLVAYSRRDASLLARHHRIDYTDPGAQPSQAAIRAATRLLVAAAQDGSFTQTARILSKRLWSQPHWFLQTPSAGLSQDLVDAHLLASQGLRNKLGHYLGATFYYAGEWYWGIDRLHHLEARLISLGAQRDSSAPMLFPPTEDSRTTSTAQSRVELDFFFSLRSPYSAIVTPRVFDLARRTGASVNLRYLLPMVMRGLPVPRAKRTYIALDAAREAHIRAIPFGRINDPVGRPTERGLAVLALAISQGKGQAFLSAFMEAVWARGVDAGSDRGLRTIAEQAGIEWADARQALQESAWRATAEANRQDLFALGLWGVPSFRVGELAVWGQDRLWAIEQALSNPRNTPLNH